MPLLLVSGYMLIRFDAVGYKKQGMQKEHKLSRFLGWTNIVLGIGMYILKGVFY